MKGRSFLECVEEGSDWTKWFVDHYHDSTKREHKIFISFVEKYVTQAEQIEAELCDEPPVTKGAKPLKVSPKSKAAPKARARDDAPEIPWEMLEEPAISDQVATLNSPHDANGAGDAGNDHGHPSAQCTPELLLSEVAQCQRELSALVMQNQS